MRSNRKINTRRSSATKKKSRRSLARRKYQRRSKRRSKRKSKGRYEKYHMKGGDNLKKNNLFNTVINQLVNNINSNGDLVKTPQLRKLYKSMNNELNKMENDDYRVYEMYKKKIKDMMNKIKRNENMNKFYNKVLKCLSSIPIRDTTIKSGVLTGGSSFYDVQPPSEELLAEMARDRLRVANSRLDLLRRELGRRQALGPPGSPPPPPPPGWRREQASPLPSPSSSSALQPAGGGGGDRARRRVRIDEEHNRVRHVGAQGLQLSTRNRQALPPRPPRPPRPPAGTDKTLIIAGTLTAAAFLYYYFGQATVMAAAETAATTIAADTATTTIAANTTTVARTSLSEALWEIMPYIFGFMVLARGAFGNDFGDD